MNNYAELCKLKLSRVECTFMQYIYDPNKIVCPGVTTNTELMQYL